MKSISRALQNSLPHAASLIAAAGLFAIAIPGGAEGTSHAQSQPQSLHMAAAASTSVKSGAAQKQAGHASHSERAEARIAELHSKLGITPAQEDKWTELTQVMRDNARALDSLAQTRIQNSGRMTAIEDLQSYSQMADAHADGLKRFIPAFQSLYDTMSDTQKKQADALFHGGTRMASSRAASKGRS